MRKFLLTFAMFAAAVSVLAAGVNYVLDPLYFYRFPSWYEPQYSTDARTQLPGFIRNADYDTLIVGTSMSRNFVESDVDALFGSHSLNASIPASTSREQRLAIELALKRKPVKRVFWEINFHSLARPADDVEDSQDEFPYHLWDDNPVNDVRYVFSGYPLQRFYAIITANARQSRLNRDREQLFKFVAGQKPVTADKVREWTEVPQTTNRTHYRAEWMNPNFDENVLSTIRRNPDVEFDLFYPPYGIFWHLRANRQNFGYIDEVIETKQYIYEAIRDLPNVNVHDFQDWTEVTHSIENYFDMAHYFPDINVRMMQMMRESEGLRSTEEAAAKSDSLRRHVAEADRRGVAAIMTNGSPGR